MSRTVRQVQGYAIHATDGDIGKLDEFYFEDDTWTIRYLVVQTGSWLLDRRVLISPISVQKANWPNRHITVSLTLDQVRNSPDIDTAKPVSRQHEIALHDYYRWEYYYWLGPQPWGLGAVPGDPWPAPLDPPPDEMATEAKQAPASDKTSEDTHLRSTKEVMGYHVHAQDGEIGHVQDFIFDERTWHIDHLVVDTLDWWFGKKVIISPTSVQEVDWPERQVVVNLKRETIRNSPEFHLHDSHQSA